VTRLAFLAILLGLTAGTVSAQVEIDNDWVRVLRLKQRPHEKTFRQEHAASILVYLTDCHQTVTPAEGKAEEINRKAGDVVYSGPIQQVEENISDQPLEAVVIELKVGPAKRRTARILRDPVKLDPKHHIVLVENDRVRVLQTILEPHLKAPMHEHPHYVVVYLTELHTTMIMGDGKAVDNPRRAGEIAWREALKHATENIGDRTAMEIQVELK
jgi:quercetin dioxygenase-like cupin family protein